MIAIILMVTPIIILTWTYLRRNDYIDFKEIKSPEEIFIKDLDDSVNYNIFEELIIHDYG